MNGSVDSRLMVKGGEKYETAGDIKESVRLPVWKLNLLKIRMGDCYKGKGQARYDSKEQEL